jgi:hypothetical protein
VLARPRSEGDTDRTTIVGRSDRRAATAGLLLHLVFFGLIGATTVILFAVASVAFLTVGNNPIMASCIDNRVLPPADPSLERSSEQYSSPKPDLAEMHPAFAAQPASNAEASEMAGAKASLELPSSDRTVSTTTEPLQIGDRSGGPTQSTEARGSEPIPLEPLLVPDTSVIPETGPSVASVTTPAEVRDQIPREVEFQRGQPTKLDQDNLASDEKALAQQVQNQRVPHKPVTQNADLRNRVQKECGSIIFPALRRHCVASFGVPYR